MRMDFSFLPHWVSAIVLVALATAAVIYALDKRARERSKDVNEAGDNLIKLLKETVDELKTKVDGQEIEIKSLRKAVTELENENEKLVEILQGRDEKTQEFYRQAFEAFKVMQETQATVKVLSENFVNTNKNIENLLTLMSKHVDVIDHSIKSK